MKMWVTGSLGMLGSSIVSLLEKRKIPFFATDKMDADITDFAKLASFSEKKYFTHIINCAAYTNVEKAEKEKELAFQTNAKGVQNLALLAKERKAKLVHFSTDYVFDGRKRSPYVEEDLPNPLNEYGKSKLKGEEYILSLLEDALILRTSWLFGLGGMNFVTKMLHNMEERKEIEIVEDQIGRPTCCSDLAEALLLLISERGIFHFANREATSWYLFGKTIWEETNKMGFSLRCEKIVPVKSVSKINRPLYSVLATDKAERILGGKLKDWQTLLPAYLMELRKCLCR